MARKHVHRWRRHHKYSANTYVYVCTRGRKCKAISLRPCFPKGTKFATAEDLAELEAALAAQP